jgi:hypothetical protein
MRSTKDEFFIVLSNGFLYYSHQNETAGKIISRAAFNAAVHSIFTLEGRFLFVIHQRYRRSYPQKAGVSYKSGEGRKKFIYEKVAFDDKNQSIVE